MARFVVLDQSLTGVGGHHYEQAVQVLRAANQMGFEPVLAANRRFTQRALLPAHWDVFPLFEDASYDCLGDYPLDMDGRPLQLAGRKAEESKTGWPLAAALQRVHSRWNSRQRRRRIQRFADGCCALDEEIRLRDADQVFLPTISLFDLLGLARFVQATRPLRNVIFHALFHYGFLQGREPEYAEQEHAERNARDQLEYLLRKLPDQGWRFYSTTSKLAEQFNRLSLTRFGVLPFPVDSHAFQNSDRGSETRLLRITCAGFLRREKGKGLASRFVRGLWDRELAAGRMQLVLQTNRRQARRMIPPHARVSLRFHSGLERVGAEPIVWLRHPLTHDAYNNMIRNSDAAVFLHDGRAYYTRCSGVLVEMLAGGVPVLVPAGSWLSDQVAESISEHLDELRARARIVQVVTEDKLAWGTAHGSPLEAGDCRQLAMESGPLALVCEASVPPRAAALLVSFRWPRDVDPGTYVRLSIEQGTANHASSVSVLGPRAQGKLVSSLAGLQQPVSRVPRRFANAYGEPLPRVSGVTFHFLAEPSDGGSTYPAGKVGLVFADVSQLPGLLENIREHYRHYLESARLFAHDWRHWHDAQRIVECLLDGDVVGGDGQSTRAVA